MKSHNYPAAALLFFTPAISVELLTGNTPLHTYLNPLVFVTLNISYGGVLLVLRETIIRWRKGFASTLILAAGYGMLCEGVGTKGFFDPHFYAVVDNGLVNFGRLFDINVAWAINISIFHAVFSMIVPLVIVTVIFPCAERWIGSKTYYSLLAAIVANTIFTFIAFPGGHYNEGPGPLLLILTLMAAVIVAAWKLPTLSSRKWNVRPYAAALFILGATYAAAFYIAPNIVRMAFPSPTVYIIFLLVFFVAIPVLLICKIPQPTPRHKIALAAGLLTPMMLHGLHTGFSGSLAAVVVVLILLAAAFLRSSRAVPLPGAA